MLNLNKSTGTVGFMITSNDSVDSDYNTFRGNNFIIALLQIVFPNQPPKDRLVYLQLFQCSHIQPVLLTRSSTILANDLQVSL